MGDARLVLIRHSKAADGPYDVDRPLAPQGEKDAAAIGTILTGHDLVPDRVVISRALRARQTWDGAGIEAADTIIDERIYDNDVESLLVIIRGTPDTVRTLALVGHNPSFAELATALDDGAGDDEAREELQRGYATSGVAVFELSGAWPEVGPGNATLRLFSVGREPTP